MGVLNKFTKVPEHKPYEFNFNRAFVLVIGTIAAICMAALLFSCSIEKKIAKTYKNAEVYNPLTKEDSLHLLRASKKVIKAQPPKTIPGKTIKVPYPVKTIVTIPDTIGLQSLKDSFQSELEAQGISLTDQLNKNYDKAYKDGFKNGYTTRNKEIAKDSFNLKLPDTTNLPDEGTEADLSDCQISLAIAKENIIKVTAERDIYNKQANKFWLWLLIGLIVGGGVVKIYSVLKSKLPA